LVTVIKETQKLVPSIEIVEQFIEMIMDRERQKPNKNFASYEVNFRHALKVLAEFERLKDEHENMDLGLDYLLIWALEMGLLTKRSIGLQFRSEHYQIHFEN